MFSFLDVETLFKSDTGKIVGGDQFDGIGFTFRTRIQIDRLDGLADHRPLGKGEVPDLADILLLAVTDVS